MNITFVIANMSAGGAERILSLMGNYWVEKNWHITLITFMAPQTDFYPLHTAIKRVRLKECTKSSSFFINCYRAIQLIPQLRQAIKQSNPDVVISFMTKNSIVTLLATLNLGLKVIASEHIMPAEHNNGWFWDKLRYFSYAWASAVTALTTDAQQWLQKNTRSRKVVVLPNPVKIDEIVKVDRSLLWSKFSPRLVNSKVLITAGRLNPQKGFDLLLPAFAHVAAIYPEWMLVIFGEGAMRNKLLQLATKLGIEQRVVFPGVVKNLYSYLYSADLFVLSSRYEGFPCVLLEAMACGLPVISFACQSGPNEIIRDGFDGVLVQPGEISALAAALQKLMASETERAFLAKNATDVLVRYNQATIMNRWETLLQEVTTTAT